MPIPRRLLSRFTAGGDLPPGPRRPAALQTLAWARTPVELLESCARRFGARFTLRFIGGRRYVILSDPADVKEVFTAPREQLLAGRANAGFRPFTGDHSLFVLDGAAHQRHRRLINPHLKGERMRAYGGLIRDLALRAVDRWPVGRSFPIRDEMLEITRAVIFRAILGVVDPERDRRMTSLLHELTDSGTAALAFIRPLQVDLGPRSPWGRFLSLRRQLAELLQEEVDQCRRGGRARPDVLAQMVINAENADDPLSDREIIDELLTLLAAGHETSTAALAWAFQWILADPDVRQRATDEARAHAVGEVFDPEQFRQLSYLAASSHETLRMTPVVPIVPRWVAQDLELDGLRIPRGTYVAPCSYLAQRDPRSFADPDRFRPERFIGSRPSRFAYFPFGGAHRVCVGNSFTQYEVVTILATVLAAADLRLDIDRPQACGRRGLTITPKLGTPVVVERKLAGRAAT